MVKPALRFSRHRGKLVMETVVGGRRSRRALPTNDVQEAKRLVAEGWTPSKVRRSKAAFVYFVQMGEGGPIKIGSAADLGKRVSGLDTASPYPLRLLGVLNGGVALEREMHKRFRAHHMRLEWFQPAQALLEFIASNAYLPASGPHERPTYLDLPFGCWNWSEKRSSPMEEKEVG